ncbi:hypothetical protein EMIT07CA2_550087 [Brevibacillus sp. IT-7CA2]|uniref:helix-turn-helix domain-containing protein n=1 Tax=Brevibacillus sp. IT-7CA2 TaxID=3026436 RepID=UPI0039E0CE2B
MDNELKIKIELKIREIRERFGITSQRELASLAGLRFQTINELENGYRVRNGIKTPIQRIEFEHLEKIAEAIWREKGIWIGINDLLEFKGEMETNKEDVESKSREGDANQY